MVYTTSAYAASLQVINKQDSGPGSLRQAITDADATTEADTITFTFSGTIMLMSTLPEITSQIIIDGSGQNVTISGNNDVRVMVVAKEGTLELRHLTIADGFVDAADALDGGGGILSHGTLTVRNCVFSDNTTTGSISGGGAIRSDFNNVLTISDSTFSGNRATGGVNYGGAVWTFATILTITRSTFIQNSAFSGGAIHTFGSQTNVSNSTLSSNSSVAHGAA